MDEFFFLTNDFPLLECCQLYLIAKYNAGNRCKIEAVIQSFSVKKVFLKIFQNSQENPCVRVSFLLKLQLKKRIQHKYFPVNNCENFKNIFFYRVTLVTASDKIRTKSLKSPKFQFQLFLTTLDIMGSLYVVTKQLQKRYPQKNMCGGPH